MSGQHRQQETVQPALPRNLAARSIGALLSVAISVIHVIDQGGFPGSMTPPYVGILFYVLEAAGIVTAILLLAGFVGLGWFLALGISAGPLVCYLFSRGTGLPGYGDDIGNWLEPLGILSLVVEAGLFVLAAAMLKSLVRPGKVRTAGG